jgi:hypothetical protein
VLYFPKSELFSNERLQEGMKKFRGVSDFRFKEIVYIVDGKVHRI